MLIEFIDKQMVASVVVAILLAALLIMIIPVLVVSVFGIFHGVAGSGLAFLICIGVLAGIESIFFPGFITSTLDKVFGLNPK
tara:strand:+ start:122 stop:367 length:246 start_codon:yes stop_codon:yes gene_type:complete